MKRYVKTGLLSMHKNVKIYEIVWQEQRGRSYEYVGKREVSVNEAAERSSLPVAGFRV